MKNNTTTIRIRHEANLTSNGKHHHGCCKPVIAIDIQKTFNSVSDAAEYFGVNINSVILVLKGKQKAIRMYERDENGNRTRFIGTCRLSYAAHAETAIDELMNCGRKYKENLHKANENISNLQTENYELKQEIAKLNSIIINKDSYKNGIEAMTMEIKNYRASLEKAQDDVELFTMLIEEAEQKLHNMIWG